jgi:hypothetical protein
MNPHSDDQAEATFMVFSLDDALVGIPTSLVESVLPDPARPPASAGSGGPIHVQPDGAPRLLMLRQRPGALPVPPLRTGGALRVAALRPTQVVELPPLCKGPSSAVVGVALAEEQVLFLVLDPYRLAPVPPSGRRPARIDPDPSAW